MVTAQKKKQLKLRMAVSRSKNKQDLKIEPTHHLSESEVIFKAVLFACELVWIVSKLHQVVLSESEI